MAKEAKKEPNPVYGVDYPSDVLTLTIMDESEEVVLVGVRKPETNRTHPNVISTPTMRVPNMSVDAILCGCSYFVDVPVDLKLPERIQRAQYIEEPCEINNEDFVDYDYPGQGVHPSYPNDHLRYMVKNLLVQKLGQADNIETDTVQFKAWPRALLTGNVLYDRKTLSDKSDKYGVKVNDEKNTEIHRMLNVKLVISDPSLIPNNTASYKDLQWMSIDDFDLMVGSNGILGFPPSLQETYYCAQGMCLISSYIIVKKLLNSHSGN
jgi:hypothetical protein